MTKERPKSDQDMLDGYQDGQSFDVIKPPKDASHCYIHGFNAGRSVRAGAPTAAAKRMRQMSNESKFEGKKK